MRRRRGRARKAGARERNGRVKRQAETPRTVAASMPHRKGLGELATDQRAVTQLGRLVLRGELDAAFGLAGEAYLGLWRGYVWTLAGPRELAAGDGHGFTCDGCGPNERPCRCEFRRRVYAEASGVLRGCGFGVSVAVTGLVIHDLPVIEDSLPLVRVGLGELARHFGLTARANVVCQKITTRTVPPGP